MLFSKYSKLFQYYSLILLVFITGCSQKVDTIKIGAPLSLTGRGATYGQWVKNGMEIAYDEIVKNDFLKGKKIEIIYEDTQSETKSAVSALNKLINIDKVLAVVGPILSDEVLACAPIANDTKTVILAPAAGSDQIKDAGDYVFRNRESGLTQGLFTADFCYNELKFSESAILFSNTANAIDYKDAYKKRFLELGGEVILTDGFNEGTQDFRTVIAKLKNLQPQVVYITGLAREIAYILKQSKELGFKTQFVASFGAEDPKLIEIAGNAAEGLILGSPSFNPDSNDKTIQAFQAKYKEKYGEDANVFAANGYDAIYLLINTVKNSRFDSDIIKQGLYDTKNYQGAGGVISFDNLGEVSKPIIMKIVKNLRFKIHN